MYKIMPHERNQHGYGVSLVKYEQDELRNGFVLVTQPTAEARDKYVQELAEMTGWEVEPCF